MKARGYVTCQVCNRSEVYCDEIDGLGEYLNKMVEVIRKAEGRS